MENSVSMKEILLTFRRRLWLILCIPIVFGAASIVYTHFYTAPAYSATTQVLVNQVKATKSYLYNTNAIQTNAQLVNTYSGLVNNPTVLNRVITNLNLKMTPEEMSGMLTVQPTQDNQLLTLTIQSENPNRSISIVNGVAKALKAQVKTIMGEDNINILSPASSSSGLTIIPAPLEKNLVIAVLVGFMVSIGLAFLFDYLDDSIKNENELVHLGMPVLGVISHVSRHERRRTRTVSKSKERLNVQTVSNAHVISNKGGLR